MRKRPRFLVIYGWIFVALYSVSLITSIGEAEALGSFPIFGAILGLVVGVGLIRGSGKAVLGLVALTGFALILIVATWPSKNENADRFLGIPFHLFLLLNMLVFFFPPIAYGVIKRKEML